MISPNRLVLIAGLYFSSASCLLAAPPNDSPPVFQFRDVTAEAGLQSAVEGIQGHGAGWGDVDGDGWIDLYVATFETGDDKPNMLLRNRQGKFVLDQDTAPRISTRATGVVFADLDNDGDLDLYVGSMPAAADSSLAKRVGRALAGCSLLRNDGQGRFTNISEGNGACPLAFGGRSVTTLDFDGDGLLDLLAAEDPLVGYNGSPTHSSRLFRNLGDLQFEDVSRAAGLPANIPGLGVAAADVNNDGWPDFFLAANSGGNRLFLNDTKGRFREAPSSREVFPWPTAVGDDMVCGVVFGDVNRDGLLDVVLGQHYKRPWLKPLANRLYLNRGIHDGNPAFEDVTDEVGLVPLPMKAPHVEIQDFDNDGWPDVSVSVVKFAGGQPHPLIFRNLGTGPDGLPRFTQTALDVNDFPNDEDRSITQTGAFFDHMIQDGRITYMAPGPTADYDNDGRLDMFLPSWWTETNSLLLHNETPSGNWLQVQVSASEPVNRMGIGTRIHVYPAGKLGSQADLLGCREIATGFGYASGQPAIAHFGLGSEELVDIELILPCGAGTHILEGVKVNQRITAEP